MKSVGENSDLQKQLAAQAELQNQMVKRKSEIHLSDLLLGIAGSGIKSWDLATIVMLALKLAGLSDISWWVIFIPFLVPYIIATVVFLVKRKN